MGFGLIHSLMATAASLHYLTQVAQLTRRGAGRLRGCLLPGHRQETGDGRKSAELQVATRRDISRAVPGTQDERVQDLIKAAKAHIRSKAEHPSRVI